MKKIFKKNLFVSFLSCLLIALTPVLTQGDYLQSDIDIEHSINSSSLIINKTLISGVWHVGCDVMGNQAWVKDEISNPQGIPSKEGHRLTYCGDPAHWIIWLDNMGHPFQMDEIKSGSTGGTLNTKFYTDNTYTVTKDISTISVGERIYWTTENKGQVWHHTGITTPEIPEFTFIVNNKEYSLKPGETLIISDLQPGTYSIIEKYSKDYFIADVSIPYQIDENLNVVVSVTIEDGKTAIVNFTNERITPEKPIITPIITNTPIPVPTVSNTPIPTVIVLPTVSNTPIPTDIPVVTVEPVIINTPTITPIITINNTTTPTPTVVNTVTPTITNIPITVTPTSVPLITNPNFDLPQTGDESIFTILQFLFLGIIAIILIIIIIIIRYKRK